MKLSYISILFFLFSFSVKSEDIKPSIDKEAVRRVIKKNLSLFKKCYDDAYKSDNSLKGKIVLGWSIGSEGIVTKSWIKTTEMNNKNVDDCLMDKIKILKFPKPPEGTVAEVQFPFLFNGNK